MTEKSLGPNPYYSILLIVSLMFPNPYMTKEALARVFCHVYNNITAEV